MPDTIQIAFEAIDKGLDKAINQIDADLTKLEKQIDSTNRSAGNFGLSAEQIGAKMTQVGKAATIGLTLPIAGLAVAATKAASDLNETSNKIDTLFGKSSDAIKKFANTASTALGQSKKQALDAAADFAVFGKAAGLAGNDLVDFSKKNVQLAADMASFFNTSPEEAITAIGAAFRGESEPIRRYGVLINEASLKDQALRLGLIKTTTEALTPQARVLAAQELILKQTSAAQGDFARTSDGLANQSRILNAQFQDTIATLGQSLLPIAIKVTGAANDLLKAFNDLDQPTKDLIVGFGLMVAAAGPLLTIGGKLVTVLSALRGTSVDVAGGMITFGRNIIDVTKYLKEAGTSAETLKFAFQFLKTSGVVLGAELGIIVAGLIAIGKYIEQVGVAAQATSEDLIAMSRSGDVFKQAAATTEIFANGQNRLKDALDATHEEIKAGAKDYADYKASIEATARAAGYEINAAGDLVQVHYGLAGRTETLIQKNYLLADSNYQVSKSEETQGSMGKKLIDGLVELANRTVHYNNVQKELKAENEIHAKGLLALAESTRTTGEAEQEYQRIVKETVDAVKSRNGVVADAYKLAITYTESQRKQADVQKELDDLNAKIAARGPARVATVAAEAKVTTELTASQSALSAARAAADDIAKRDNESSARYAMRLKDAQTNLKKLTEQMGSYIPAANAAGAADQKSALNQARLAAAQEDLATAQKKKGETDIEFALRVETIKGKIADYSKTLTEHTGIVGGATKAELEQKKALEEQIAALQKADEIQKAKGAFESLTQAFRDGILSEDQYKERATALNAISNLYTESALKQATAQEILMKSFADPRSEAWRGQLQRNREAIDGITQGTGEAETAVRKLHDQAAEPIFIGVKVEIPKIDPGAKSKLAHDLMGDIKYAPPILTPKVDTKQAEKDLNNYVSITDKTPKEKKTNFVADTTTATKSTQSLLTLFGLTPAKKSTQFEVKADEAIQTYDNLYIAQERLHDKIIDIIVRYKTEGEPPTGLQHGGSYIVPPRSDGGAGDYFPILAAPGERVTVQTKAQQNAVPAPVQSGDTFIYNTNVYNPLAAAMLADKQRRDRLARSNARMGVV